MEVYIHYNLHGGNPDAHGTVKSEMKEKQYSDYYETNKKKYYLPNVSLYHANKPTTIAAYNDLKSIVDEINKTRQPQDKARIERCITLEFTGRFPFEGDPHAD